MLGMAELDLHLQQKMKLSSGKKPHLTVRELDNTHMLAMMAKPIP